MDDKLGIDYDLISKYLNKLNKNGKKNKFNFKFLNEVYAYGKELLSREVAICLAFEEIVTIYIREVNNYKQLKYEKDIVKICKMLNFLFNALKSLNEYIVIYGASEMIDNDFLYKEISVLCGLALIQEEIYDYFKVLDVKVACNSEYIEFIDGCKYENDEELFNNVKSIVDLMKKEIKEIKKYVFISYVKYIKEKINNVLKRNK